MPYSPPSSASTVVDVPHFSRPTPGDHSSTRRTRTPSASMLNFSTERGPGAHKPLRGLPRRAKPSPAPVLIDAANLTPDASTPRSIAVTDSTLPSSARSRGRAKFRVGDDDSSESASTSPKGSPSIEDEPTDDQSLLPSWASTASSPRPSPSLAKTLSIDTSLGRDEDESEPGEAVPFPLLSPEPVSIGPPTRRAAVLPLGSLPHFTSLSNGNGNDVGVHSMMNSLSLSETPPAPSPVPALLSPRLLPLGAQKSLHINGHGRSASMADARLDRSPRISPTASGATTPIIRKSNGQPLKPSLKSSLSSPNISVMNEPRRIAKSAPATPRVHFKELGLESVVLFDKGARPVAVSGEYTGADDTETETETENGRGYPFPRVATPPPALVRLAPTTTQLAFQPPPQSYVHLQYLSLPAVRPPRLHGTILVRNVTFAKSIVVRYTTDNWETASEILATYSSSLPPGIVPGSLDTPWDKFTFTIKLDDIERSLPSRTLFLVVRYDAHGAGEWWDNNQGQNYRVEFERPDSNGLGLDTQSTTGDQSCAPRSLNGLTYQSGSTPAPPPPMTKPRSYSTSVVAPPAPIKHAAPLSGGPLPHLLSLKLSNYVSPNSNSPKAPALGKPAEKKLDASPSPSPELAKRPLQLSDGEFGADFHSEPQEVFSSERAPLKMPATITPPDSAHNSPSSSPPANRKPLPPPSSLSQSNESGLLSPSSSPSTSMLITSPSSPSPNGPVETEQSPPATLLDQSYSELINRFCFHHSSPGGTPTGVAYTSAPLLGALGMTNHHLVSSPKSSPRGGSPTDSGANSPSTGSKNNTPRGSFVLGTPGAGPAFTKWTPPSGLAGL